jgi:hypothetical protein
MDDNTNKKKACKVDSSNNVDLDLQQEGEIPYLFNMEDKRVKNGFLFIVCSMYATLLKASFMKPLSTPHGSVTQSNSTSSTDNFRMNTGYGRYSATYNMVGLHCFNEELLLLPKNPTEAKLQATSTRGESTEPT